MAESSVEITSDGEVVTRYRDGSTFVVGRERLTYTAPDGLSKIEINKDGVTVEGDQWLSAK